MSDALVRESQQCLLAVLDAIQHTQPASYGKSKVIHDPIWGTGEYEAWEVRLLDSALFQRLRGLRQTGFAYLTYPTAEHSRFQHTLGVAEAAGRIFDAVVHRADRGGLSAMGLARRDGHPILDPAVREDTKSRWRMLVRLAALVHDTGHSVFSHSSERIYGLVPPLPELIQHLTTSNAKPPGAAEVVVYLVVTTPEWQANVAACWDGLQVEAPTPEEWKRIGQWVMGQEDDQNLKFLADIISGPLDADKLDYVFRDGYSAGIPVGYDLERLIATVCVDPQESVDGGLWWRLTIPVRGINALEQLVMGRLVLNSYMYHHQKCRAAEAAFERALARDYRERTSVLGLGNVWELFGLQDADAYAFRSGDSTAALELRRLYGRGLRVRVAEFRRVDLPDSSRISTRFARLLEYSRIKDWPQYYELLDLEDEISRQAGTEAGAVILDIPNNPSYADLENLLIPGRRAEAGEDANKVLAYRDWIEAYKVHRMFVRVFGPRGSEQAVWDATRAVLQGRFGLELPESVRIDR
jgi:HD superfamily phosphohydrolase